MMSRWKVYKMAAVGCMDENSAKDSEEGGDKNESDISDLCKKNGVNYKSFNERKSCEYLNSKGVFLEKITKVNGIVKSNSFTKPSIPTLRSRGERHPSGPDSPRRKRRNSNKDRNDLHVT
ncbi:hypothetical protein KUTeg_007295 [Tegillarca granosa]|uniref:Uncharacterized protein n=1 Tax=Tegillarca granosa TaxID=220873 RepID=A0ABQ9FFV2_TEGGR|nr:hypothetical protein KUTeg_007295 [Tegillarca granosa]